MEKLRKILHANTSRVKFNNQQQANFFLLLADLLSVGFSVKEALGFIKTVNPKLAPWIASIDKRMQKGASFAQSLQQEVKDDLFYQLLLAEKHGNLTKTLSEVGKILTAREQQRKKLFMSPTISANSFRDARGGDLWVNFVCFSRIESLARREANFAANSHDYVRSNVSFYHYLY